MWKVVLLEYVRVLLNDLDCDNETYSDSNLIRVIVIAAQQVEQELDFTNNYTVNIVQKSISPDPVTSNDIDFLNLTALKAACIITLGEMKTYGKNAIKVVDGPSSIDMTSQFENVQKLYEALSEEYERLKTFYQSGNVGKAILTPYALGSDLVQSDIQGRRGQFFYYGY